MNSALFSPSDFFHPLLSASVLTTLRIGYGLIMIATLLISLPNPRFFLSERWGGYAKSAREVDFIQNPLVYPWLMLVWFACNGLLILGRWTVLAALINLLICRYFFVYMRWKGIARGMGAPGFMSYWMGFGVFLLEYAQAYAPELLSLVIQVIQVDFAFIMFSAGYYKFRAGYADQAGMETGMANPQWAFWPRYFANRPPNHWTMRAFNQLAWMTEVGAAICMLIPPLRFIGGLLIAGSFLFLTTQIRLGWLAQLVILCTVTFFHPGSFADQTISQVIPAALASTNVPFTVSPVVSTILAALLWAYLLLLPLAHAGLFYNFYGKRSLPQPLQRILERYTNFFGLIIWRVFSADLVNFYIMIYHQPRGGGERQLISKYGWSGGGFLNRFNHVCESVTITSVFSTLKYYPSNNQIFEERLLRYARTLPCPADHELIFEYVSIGKDESGTRLAFTTLAEYVVDPATECIQERILSDVLSVRAHIKVSPVHEGIRPGSYVPLGSG